MRLTLTVYFRANGATEDDAKTTLYYFCDRCGKKLTSKKKVREHILRVHEGVETPKKPSTCNVCSKTFDTEYKMKYHRGKEHHRFQCELCEYQCALSSGLRKHMARHAGPSFKCGFCDKMVKSRASLVVHEREHTGERPYKCAVCGNGYKSGTVLGTHMKHVHNVLTPRMKPVEKRVRKR